MIKITLSIFKIKKINQRILANRINYYKRIFWQIVTLRFTQMWQNF